MSMEHALLQRSELSSNSLIMALSFPEIELTGVGSFCSVETRDDWSTGKRVRQVQGSAHWRGRSGPCRVRFYPLVSGSGLDCDHSPSGRCPGAAVQLSCEH